MHLHVQLTLWRNLIEASSASITLHIYDAETIAGILADALEAREQTRFNLHFKFLGFFLELFFLLTRFLHDFVELAFLFFQVFLTLVYQHFSVFQIGRTLINANACFPNLLVAEFDFKCLELDFLAQHVIFAVVPNLVELFLITLHSAFGGLNLTFLLYDGSLEFSYFCLNFLNTGVQTCNFIFEVLHFQWQFSAQCTFLINGRESCLQLEQVLQLLLYGEVFGIFLCHSHFICI